MTSNWMPLVHEHVDGATGRVTVKTEQVSLASILGSYFNRGQGRASRLEVTRAVDGSTDTWTVPPDDEGSLDT